MTEALTATEGLHVASAVAMGALAWLVFAKGAGASRLPLAGLLATWAAGTLAGALPAPAWERGLALAQAASFLLFPGLLAMHLHGLAGRASSGRTTAVLLVAVGATLALLLALVTAPHLFVGDAPLLVSLTRVSGIVTASMAVAVLVLVARPMPADPADREARSLTVAGLLCIVSYQASVLVYPFLVVGWPEEPRSVPFVLAGVLAAAAAIGTAARVLRDRAWPRHELVLTLCAAPFIVGVLEGGLLIAIFGGVAAGSQLNTYGLWRVASAGLLAYALLRGPGADSRQMAGLMAGGYAVGVSLALTWSTLARLGGDVGWVAAGSAGAAMVAAPVARFAYRRIVDAPRAAWSRRYVVERELGRGTSSRVLLATDRRSGRRVVLKEPLDELDEPGRAVFLREARMGGRLRHPNVAAVLDVLDVRPRPVLVLEHVPGGSLEAALERGPMPPEEALRIAGGVLAGLAEVHRAGIVHRDLKPANILLDADGTPKIADFGIAQPPSEMRLAQTIQLVGQPGSVAYMSPEQAAGEALDARSDVYAAGVILYRMLTGEHYLDLRRLSENQAREAVRTRVPRLPHPLVPASVEGVLRRALEKTKDARFPDAEAMARAIGGLL